jgi:ADP-ribose pyrophosphatase YjhB (NUDIX family)
MAAGDCLFRTGAGLFSYRVAGVLLEGGKVLLQHPPDKSDFAFPGGHVGFGEGSEEALAREFREEVGAAVRTVRLLWIGENFFPWGKDPCHQISLYYLLEAVEGADFPRAGSFFAQPEPGREVPRVVFSWVALEDLAGLLVYPPYAKEQLLSHLSEQVERFVFRQEGAGFDELE